jgi:hypothetical protein
LRYREYKKGRGSDADEMPIKRRLAEIHANRILKLDRVAKQDEPASNVEADRVIKPVFKANGMKWKGWHAYRRGLATNLHELGVPDKVIQYPAP